MYDGNPGEIDFGSSQREVRVSEGSSYRESTVVTMHIILSVCFIDCSCMETYIGRSIFVGYGLQHSAGDILYTQIIQRFFFLAFLWTETRSKSTITQKKKNEASQRYRTRLARDGQRTFSCGSNAGNPGWARRAHVGKPKSMFKDICGMAQKYNLFKSLFLFFFHIQTALMRCKTKTVKITQMIAKRKNDMLIIVISGSTVARLVTVST